MRRLHLLPQQLARHYFTVISRAVQQTWKSQDHFLTFAGNATFTAFWTAIRTIELPLVTSEGLQRGAESHNSRVHVALNAERKLEQARKNKPPPQNIKKGLWP